MKETTVFLLDASPSMKAPFPSEQDSKVSTRLDCGQKAVDTWIRDYIAPNKDKDSCVLILSGVESGNLKSENVLHANNTTLNQGDARQTRQLTSRNCDTESSGETESRSIHGDFCEGLLMATDILQQSSQTQARRRIVLLTDAEHDVLMNVEQILVAIDQLRNLQCRLEVIGFNFTKSAVYEQPASADSGTATPAEQVDSPQQGTASSDVEGETDEDGSDSDETPEGCVRYTDKVDREALLLSLVEKTGGNVVAVTNMQQVLEAGQSIFAMSTVAPADTEEEGAETLLRPNKFSRLNATNEWACARCTLINDNAAMSCQACGAAREDGPIAPTETVNEVRQEQPRRPLALPSNFKIVSLNVAGFEPSAAAPTGWMPMPAFTAEILRHSPDVICLQEVPPGREQFLFTEGFECIGTCPSHCLNVALLLKQEWVPHASIVPGIEPPAVLASVEFTSKTIVFGSCHLEPFARGRDVRLDQMREIREHMRGSTLILAGDYNMRQTEDRSFEALGFKDAWKEAGKARDKKFTWDSKDRSPRGLPGIGPHNQYHGDGAFQFFSRFDRVYFQGDELVVENFDLMANTPLMNPFHFLSDHFGMVSTFKVKSSSSSAAVDRSKSTH